MNEHGNDWDEAKEWIKAICGGLAMAAIVMAIFLAVFVLFPAPAMAGEKVMVTMFNPEVRIVLTQRPSEAKKGWAQCVAQRIDKQYMLGNWKYLPETKMIRIEWVDSVANDFTELPAKNFQEQEMPDQMPTADKNGHIEGDSI